MITQNLAGARRHEDEVKDVLAGIRERVAAKREASSRRAATTPVEYLPTRLSQDEWRASLAFV